MHKDRPFGALWGLGLLVASAALVMELPPGTYRAEAYSVTGASGVCLLEVYEVPDIE